MQDLSQNHAPGCQATKASEPLVSVVTPVHNTAQYLADCIRSVLAQSYQTWEYVIVNNASTDGSLEIARSFAAQDARIRIVNTDRLLPQVQNYNFALKQISRASRYCKIVQADDWIYPDCLREMVTLANSDPQISIVSAYWVNDRSGPGATVPSEGPERIKTVLSGREACRHYFLRDIYLFGSPTSVLYTSDLVRSRDPFFLEIEPGYFEDAELCFEVLIDSKLGFVRQILTYLRTQEDSIRQAIMSFDLDLIMKYMMIKKYGRLYLDESEYDYWDAKISRQYYHMLAWCLFRRRGDAFWKYHARGLELVGDRLDWGRVLRLQIPRFLNLVGNPKKTLEGLFEALGSLKRPPGMLPPGRPASQTPKRASAPTRKIGDLAAR
jgi:glycosyltransferase involved in cell wall biosynthesis